MSTVPSSKILGGAVDGPDPQLIVTPDTSAPLKPGKYVFSLVVTDDAGLQSAAATAQVEVRNAPGVKLSGPGVVAFNQNITLNAEVGTTGRPQTFTWSVKSAG
jgi:hypothetical protein